MKEQVLLFQKLKEIIPKSVSFVNEIAELLNLSIDATYRRIRGESVLSFDEAIILLNKYGVDLDSSMQLFKTNNKVVPFRYNSLYENSKAFVNYIQFLVQELKLIVEAKHSKIIITALDIPIFYYFQFPTLSKFKLHYWLKSIMNISVKDSSKTMEEEPVLQNLLKFSRYIFEYFQQISSTEVWTDSTVESFIKQIQFYADIEEMPIDELLKVCDEAILMLNFIHQQVRLGKKQFQQKDKISFDVVYEFYISEVMFGTNLILIEKDKVKMSFISHQSFNSMSTFDETFYDENFKWYNGVLQRSMLLSNSAEKIRNIFFKQQIQKIENLKAKLSNR